MLETTISAFINEFTKIANLVKVANAVQAAQQVAQQATQKAPGFIRRNIKPIGYMALGGAGALQGQQMVNDYSMGRMIRKQNDAQQSMY